jgi:hypothetical protein
MRHVTYLYEDLAHPDRPTGYLESPEWTEEDRALLLALAEYEATLCRGCGEPKQVAWHSHMEGFYEGEKWVCHACTAQADHQVIYSTVQVDKDLPASHLETLPPFEIGITTTPPSEIDTN